MPYKKLSLATTILLLTQGTALPFLAAAVAEGDVVGISPGAASQQALRQVPYRLQRGSVAELAFSARREMR